MLNLEKSLLAFGIIVIIAWILDCLPGSNHQESLTKMWEFFQHQRQICWFKLKHVHQKTIKKKSVQKWLLHVAFNPLPDDKILDRSKLKQSVDNNFKFDENSRKFSKRVETLWVKEKLLVTSNFSFAPVFSKGLFPRGVKRSHCVGMG